MEFPYQSERIAARGSPHRRMRSILLIARNVPGDPGASDTLPVMTVERA